LWFTRKNLGVIPVLFLIVIMLAGGASRTVHAAQALPGTPIGKGTPPILVVDENGAVMTFSGPAIAGDLVLCETAGCSEDPSSWSDVLRFCDTPLDDAACAVAQSATHFELFTDKEGASGFTDEFTGHSLDASKLMGLAVVIDESTTGPTSVGMGALLINSDPTGPGEVVDAPVGGYVVSINMMALVGPWVAVIGVLGCAVVVAVAVKKHRR
jgi:hypothetical protein